jgi:hypothetical protein
MCLDIMASDHRYTTTRQLPHTPWRTSENWRALHRPRDATRPLLLTQS